MILKSNVHRVMTCHPNHSSKHVSANGSGRTLTLYRLQLGALEAHHVLGEDPRVHVLAPDNVPLRILQLVDGAVVGVAAGAGLRGPCLDNLRPAHQHAAQHDVCLAAPVCLGQHRTDQTQIQKDRSLAYMMSRLIDRATYFRSVVIANAPCFCTDEVYMLG
jgi:hypothetical protein